VRVRLRSLDSVCVTVSSEFDLDAVTSGEKDNVWRSVTVAETVAVGSLESVAERVAVDDAEMLPLAESTDDDSASDEECEAETLCVVDAVSVPDHVPVPCSESVTDLVTKRVPVIFRVVDAEMDSSECETESVRDCCRVLDGDDDWAADGVMDCDAVDDTRVWLTLCVIESDCDKVTSLDRDAELETEAERRVLLELVAAADDDMDFVSDKFSVKVELGDTEIDVEGVKDTLLGSERLAEVDEDVESDKDREIKSVRVCVGGFVAVALLAPECVTEREPAEEVVLMDPDVVSVWLSVMDELGVIDVDEVTERLSSCVVVADFDPVAVISDGERYRDTVSDKVDDADTVGVTRIVTLCVSERRERVIFDDSVADPDSDPVERYDLL
jgi:hypothetical protein